MSKHITGHTGLLCLLGSPVAHSVSPEMHNEACDQLGLDYTYLAFDVPEDKMPEAVQGLRTMGARGWNITMPGKNIMCKLADKVSPASETVSYTHLDVYKRQGRYRPYHSGECQH